MIFKKLFESTEVKKARNELHQINKMSDEISKLSDEQLKNKTNEFKKRVQEGDETTDDIRVEAFAVAREATFRVLGKRPFDVQMLGGLILDYGSVAEMKTGEGKTITSIAPVYLNAIPGKGVIVSTVNEYLTERDAEEMGRVHQWMGLTVGVNKREMAPYLKKLAYASDITYSVHSEIGFDYLRDNMVKKMEEKCQRGFNYVLIDEVDSILIDEARTPLIISGGQSSPSQIYQVADQFVKGLKESEYDIDWESKSIQLNEDGIDRANVFFKTKNFFSMQFSEMVHRVQNALKANYIFKKDVDYIVRDGKIEIVDSFTGRIMEGRSYSDGLHQAIQAKELVEIEPETKTQATITYQNLFRSFRKLSGMSGTAKTEENEFIEIYNMRVHVIPTNKPIKRIDQPNYVFASAKAKYKAIIKEIKERNKKGQPVLVGTEEVSESEKISQMLTKEKIKHTILNAKQNQAEADIIAVAGQVNSITIATNMAGRGTDIKPSDEAKNLGGLYVIGTSKAESRRIDNQLRGRSGRQGDVGESRFFLSLDDTLISRFSNQEKLKKMFASFKDEPIKGKAIVKALDRAQVKIEGFNFDSRKDVLQYDDVIRQQRDLMYSQRDIIIGHEDLINVIRRMMMSVVKEAILDFTHFRKPDGSTDIDKMCKVLNSLWFKNIDFKLEPKTFEGKSELEVVEIIQKDIIRIYDEMRLIAIENVTEVGLHDVERRVILSTFDINWQVHIDQMSKLRSSTSLVSYAQQNPYQVYVQKGADLFNELIKRISHNTVKLLMIDYSFKKQEPKPEPETSEDVKKQIEILKSAISKARNNVQPANDNNQVLIAAPVGDIPKPAITSMSEENN